MDSSQASLSEQFIAVTGADPEFANSFLEASGWNLDEALNMYLGGGGAQAASMTATAPQPPVRAHAARRAQEESNDALTQRVRVIMEEQGVDEATALAIAEAQGENTASEVRAPIAATTGRLIDHGEHEVMLRSGRNVSFRDFAAETRALEARLAREQGGLFSTFVGERGMITQDSGEEDLNEIEFLGETSGGISEHFDAPGASSRAANLQALFSPPRDILFQGTWDQAREIAKDCNKWILVNIQKDSEFLSYNLNRDLWSNEIIKDLIRNYFIFFQHEESDSEAIRYKTYYKPDAFPHVAIIDPFTGEQMVVLDLVRFQHDPTDLMVNFLEAVNVFLERNKLEGDKLKKMQAMMQRKFQKDQNKVATKRKTEQEKPKEIDIEDSSKFKYDPSVGFNLKDDDGEKMAEDDDSDEKFDLSVEPPEGEDVTTIQIRLFGKKTVRRRFKKTEKVGALFAFVRKEYPEARGKKFDLSCFPPRSLLQFQELTLLDQKLLNTSLTAVFT